MHLLGQTSFLVRLKHLIGRCLFNGALLAAVVISTARIEVQAETFHVASQICVRMVFEYVRRHTSQECLPVDVGGWLLAFMLKRFSMNDVITLVEYPLLKDTACEDEANWKSALQSMVKVNDDFKVRYNDVVPKKGREHQWRSLQQLLQGD